MTSSVSEPTVDTSTPANSAIPEAIGQLVEIFEADLPNVAFPGVDATTLRRLADTMEATAVALDDAEQALTLARREHSDARQALTLAAERGFGYAKVYATADEALYSKLDALRLGVKPKRKTTRARKAPPRPEELPAADDAGGTLTELPFARKSKGKGKAATA